MTHHDHALTRQEVASLLAHVIFRMILPPQNVPHSDQDCLDVIAKEVLTVSTTVNNHGDPGDQ